MKTIVLLFASVAAFAQGQSPTLQPVGIWPACGKIGGIFAYFCQFHVPGTETWLLTVRATSANTMGYVYTVRANSADGSEVTSTGYIARTDTPDGRPSSAVLVLGLISTPRITVHEVITINTQQAGH